jgi:hypothetical protein
LAVATGWASFSLALEMGERDNLIGAVVILDEIFWIWRKRFE